MAAIKVIVLFISGISKDMQINNWDTARQTNKMTCASSEDLHQPAQADQSLRRRLIGSLATHWAHSKESNQTRRLIWVFVVCTCHFVGFVVLWHIIALLRPVCQKSKVRCGLTWRMFLILSAAKFAGVHSLFTVTGPWQDYTKEPFK